MRVFASGATRDTDAGKLDYEGFLSTAALKCYAAYLDRHRLQADGQMRDSDNWQRGLPRCELMKSAWRHHVEWWTLHRKELPHLDKGLTHTPLQTRVEMEEAICGVIFNAMAYLHELARED